MHDLREWSLLLESFLSLLVLTRELCGCCATRPDSAFLSLGTRLDSLPPRLATVPIRGAATPVDRSEPLPKHFARELAEDSVAHARDDTAVLVGGHGGDADPAMQHPGAR